MIVRLFAGEWDWEKNWSTGILGREVTGDYRLSTAVWLSGQTAFLICEPHLYLIGAFSLKSIYDP